MGRDAPDDGNAAGPAGPEPGRAPFGADEWEALCRAPMIVFLTLACARGAIDAQATETFGTLLAGRVVSVRGGVLTRILRGTLLRRDAILAESAGGALDPEAVLAAARAALDARLPAAQARRVKLGLLALGKAVAESSGRRRGGLLGLFRDPLTREDRVMLARLAKRLGLVGDG